MKNSLTIDFINDIIIPYANGEWLILLWDCFVSHYNKDVIDLCINNKIIIVLVPPKCTSKLQPLDVAVNKSLKSFIASRCEKRKLNQTNVVDISKDIIIDVPERSQVIGDVCDFTDNDYTGKNGFKAIGFFDNKIKSNIISYDGVFVENKEYTISHKRKEKIINIG